MISFGHADPKVVRKMQRIHVAFCQLILKLIHASRGNAVQGGELSYMTLAMERVTRANRVQLATAADGGGPSRP